MTAPCRGCAARSRAESAAARPSVTGQAGAPRTEHARTASKRGGTLPRVDSPRAVRVSGILADEAVSDRVRSVFQPVG